MYLTLVNPKSYPGVGSGNSITTSYDSLVNVCLEVQQDIPEDLQLSLQEMSSEERRLIPAEREMTYSNGYSMRISAIFIDIRNSTQLFAHKDRDMVSRIVRSFVSEVIRILQTEKYYDIGIRGDCVYGIYSTPKDSGVYSVYQLAIQVNTLLKLLNNYYRINGYPCIKIGIGMATNTDLVVKVGSKGLGINDLVWVGKSVPTASKLSGYGNKNGISPIVMSKQFYKTISTLFKKNGDEKDWFTRANVDGRVIYHCDILDEDFDKWIEKHPPQ